MSERETITFTREQFYEKVWSVPSTRIAREMGCSDVLIGKVCKAHDIPKPYLGYWAMVEHGKNPKKTPLPQNDDPRVQSITFFKYPDRETTTSEPEPEPEYDPDIKQLLAKTADMEPVTVDAALNRPHLLVAATRKRLIALRRPYLERTSEEREPQPMLSVEVSDSLTVRALCIMDALIKRVEAIGGKVEIRADRWNKWKSHTVVCFGGEEVSTIRIREKQKQVRVPAHEKEYSWDSDTQLRPSGLLVLDKGPGYVADVLLSDTPKQRCIENGLNDLIIRFVRMAGQLRIQQREAEAASKRREEEERIARQRQEERRKQREELTRRQKQEQARVDELIRHATAWQQSQTIRGYLGALCDILLERHGAIGVNSEAAEYLRWAHKQVDRIDPLKPSPPSVLDERL